MASRLSYFLWASIPDDELRRAAVARVDRSRRDSAASEANDRRSEVAAARDEFFGQWLGFYHFDQHTGVDTGRFPEFTDDVKEAMYDEAVSFFEHVIRKERPVREILFADYAFLNKDLARFYGVEKEIRSTHDWNWWRARRVPAWRNAPPGSIAGDFRAAAHESGEARRLDFAAYSGYSDAPSRRRGIAPCR